MSANKEDIKEAINDLKRLIMTTEVLKQRTNNLIKAITGSDIVFMQRELHFLNVSVIELNQTYKYFINNDTIY
jgi:hypothetical protein